MRKIVLYSYHIDEERLSCTRNLMLERELINIESRDEHELIFAINSTPASKTRLAISSKPGQVYYNKNNNTYRVWFDSENRDQAIAAIGNYILDHVASEIKYHSSFISKLNEERLNAIKLLEQLP